MARTLKKKTVTKKNNKTSLVTFVRYYRYDIGGGGPPFGHDHDDAASLDFKNGRSVWCTRDAARVLHGFVVEHGTPTGDKQCLPYDKDYDSRSYKQQFKISARFTSKVVAKLVG